MKKVPNQQLDPVQRELLADLRGELLAFETSGNATHFVIAGNLYQELGRTILGEETEDE